MSFFGKAKQRRRHRDQLIFWIGLVVALATVYVFFFAPLKSNTPHDIMADNDGGAAKPTKAAPPSGQTANSITQQTNTIKTALPLPTCRAWFSHSEDATVTAKVDSFFPTETMYLHVAFPQLAAGSVRINVNWISPAGKHISSAEHITKRIAAGPETFFFWLSLTANGAVTEMFTGKEFKPQVYGQWQAQIFYDGELLATLPFVVHE
ncbi:MAG: hypothetical protein LBU39_07780 [Desulfobulbaceae bacterium]|jgi:hypothetical protein|nr:hypothetical protein [Desulfobulbaceae bacterium]